MKKIRHCQKGTDRFSGGWADRQLWQNTGGFNGISQFGSSIFGSKRCIR